MAPKKVSTESDPMVSLKKNQCNKFKFSPQKKSSEKSNQVFVKEYKFGLMSLTLKKGESLFLFLFVYNILRRN